MRLRAQEASRPHPHHQTLMVATGNAVSVRENHGSGPGPVVGCRGNQRRYQHLNGKIVLASAKMLRSSWP